MQLFDYEPQFVGSVARNYAAAHEQERLFRLVQRIDHCVNFLGIDGIFAAITFKPHFHGIFVINDGIEHVLGNVNDHRSRSAGTRNEKRLFYDAGQSVGIFH